MRWWWRLWCKHTKTTPGTETFGSQEYDEIWAWLICQNPKCKKKVGRKVVGYAGDGMYL